MLGLVEVVVAVLGKRVIASFDRPIRQNCQVIPDFWSREKKVPGTRRSRTKLALPSARFSCFPGSSILFDHIARTNHTIFIGDLILYR